MSIHHVTAIAGDPVKNVSFYTRDLGLRFVKKTVNFDDPSTYHFYYGDETGHPGTILTFFPWTNATAGRRGVGETCQTTFRIPQRSIGYWTERFIEKGIPHQNAGEALRSVRAAFHGSGWDGARARRRRRCRE
jgi:glyoxalase family protein